MIPVYYEFSNNTKILSGKNAIENIPFELKSLGVKRPAVIARKDGLDELVTATLSGAGIEHGCKVQDIPASLTVDLVNETAARYRENGCDGIVAAGDDAVISAAQGLALILLQTAGDVSSLAGSETITRAGRTPFITVPSQSGINPGLVIENGSPGQCGKLEFISGNLLPDVTVIDIRAAQKRPPKDMAATGMETLARAVEAYTCLGHSPLSDAYAVAAVELVRENLLTAVEKPYREEAKLAVANASVLAGISFSNSAGGLVLALSNACAEVCDIPHAIASSVLLRHCMEFNMDVCGDGYARLLPWVCGELVYASIPPQRRARRVAAEIKSFAAKFNEVCLLPLSLSSCGVTEDSLRKIAEAAVNDSAMLMNPKNATIKDVLAILKKAL